MLLVLVIVPFWASYLLRVYSWLTILGQQGMINRFLQWAGITHHPLGIFLYDRPAVILVLVYLYFPFGALTLYSSIERFDWNQLRAAMDLGASPTAGDLPDPRSADQAGDHHRHHLRVHPDPRRVPHAPDRRRHRRCDDRESDRELLPGGGVHARGCVALLVASFIILLLVIFRKSLSAKEAYGA